jgi:hypothetical protein
LGRKRKRELVTMRIDVAEASGGLLDDLPPGLAIIVANTMYVTNRILRRE